MFQERGVDSGFHSERFGFTETKNFKVIFNKALKLGDRFAYHSPLPWQMRVGGYIF